MVNSWPANWSSISPPMHTCKYPCRRGKIGLLHTYVRTHTQTIIFNHIYSPQNHHHHPGFFLSFYFTSIFGEWTRGILANCPFKGTVSRDFLYSVFFPNNSSWSHWRYPRAVSIFFASWLSYKHFKMTSWCPMYRGVNTPQCFVRQNSPVS